MIKLCKYGTHRVISPQGTLPQSADIIDNTMICNANEILVDVDVLNIDSASFTQIKRACNADVNKMKKMIMDIVNEKGKLQNPVTGSGGMFIGRVKEIGQDLKLSLEIKDPIASLVSLSLTPLKIEEITDIDLDKDQVKIVGQAILFETGIFAKIPNDLPANIVLSALDVAGAAAQVEKLVKKDDTVLILGAGGKSGILCTYQARKSAGKSGKIIGLTNLQSQKLDLERLGICDHIIVADATKAVEVYEEVKKVAPELADVTINVVNVANTEMSSILPTKNSGTIYFFSMATSFTKAALGAEGIAQEAVMIIGNGYTKNHAEFTLDLLRESQNLYELFIERYGD